MCLVRYALHHKINTPEFLRKQGLQIYLQTKHKKTRIYKSWFF